MSLAAQAGLSPSEWEDMTPSQFYAWTESVIKKQEDEMRLRQAENYNLAALIRMAVWSKHMPRYESVFRHSRKKKEMTDEEMYSAVSALNKLFGGESK